MPLSRLNFSLMAARSSGIPELGVYFVKPALSASMAAALMCSGVSKSGSPAPKLKTSTPSARRALALLSIARVSEGVSSLTRVARSMGSVVLGVWVRMLVASCY